MKYKEYIEKYPLTKEERVSSAKRVKEKVGSFKDIGSSLKERQQAEFNVPVRQQISQPRQIKFIQRLNPAPALSREQQMFQELFNGESFMHGRGENLPRTDNGNLGTDAFGGDGETGNFFGFRKGEGGY